MSKSTDVVHLDDILEKYDMFGRYHVFMYSLLNIVFIINAMYSVNFVFVAVDVPYRCKINECETENPIWDTFNFSLLQDKCYRHTISAEGTCLNKDFNTSNSIACDEWVYKDPTSFVAEFQLACQDWKRTLVGTIHMIGLMCGLLLMGPMSDRFGRKATLVFVATMGGVIGVLKSFVTSYWVFVILEFFGTFLGDTCSPAFTMSVEIVSKEKRIPFQTQVGLDYALGGVILAGIAWALPYWRHYLRAIYAPSLLFILYTFILDESARWLLSKGRREEAIKIIEKSAKMNKITIHKETLDNLRVDDEGEKVEFKVVLVKTIKSKILLKRLLVCMFWWITITFCSYGLTINSVSLDGNVYLNFIWVYLAEVPATFLVVYAFVRFKRQKPLFLVFILGGVICLSQPFLPADMSWLLISFYLFGKFAITFTFTAVYVYTSELFPTYTRNSMHALCSAVGRIGSMLAPQTPLLIPYWRGLPTLICGFMSTVAGLLTLLISDPKDNTLPDTVHQAEMIGVNNEQMTKL